MGTSQRRERERAAQREAILIAAIDIARENGWREVTIRKIADVIEYSAPTIYEHFDSKDALMLELLRRGFSMLNQRLKAALQPASGARAGIIRIAEAALDFAAEQPELYQAMHGLDGIPFGTPQTPTEAREAFATVRAAFQSLARDEGVSIPDIDGMADTLWALVHGFISLNMSHRIRGGSVRVRALLLLAVESIVPNSRQAKPSRRVKSPTRRARAIAASGNSQTRVGKDNSLEVRTRG